MMGTFIPTDFRKASNSVVADAAQLLAILLKCASSSPIHSTIRSIELESTPLRHSPNNDPSSKFGMNAEINCPLCAQLKIVAGMPLFVAIPTAFDCPITKTFLAMAGVDKINNEINSIFFIKNQCLRLIIMLNIAWQLLFSKRHLRCEI